MRHNELMQVVQRGLRIAVDMRHDAAKDGRIVAGPGAYLCIEILELDLLAPKVVSEAAKL